MITEEKIGLLLYHYHQLQIEMAIILDCSGVDTEKRTIDDPRYMLLKRQVSLIDHWLSFISKEESIIIRCRFFQNESWQAMLNMNLTCDGKSIGTDRRTLQRIQKRGLQKILEFINKRFGDTLDYLFTDDFEAVGIMKNT